MHELMMIYTPLKTFFKKVAQDRIKHGGASSKVGIEHVRVNKGFHIPYSFHLTPMEKYTR